MAKVEKLKTRAVLDQEDVVGCLETWLEYAKNGEIVSVAVAGVLANNEGVKTGYSQCNDAAQQIGALALLQSRLMALWRTGFADK